MKKHNTKNKRQPLFEERDGNRRRKLRPLQKQKYKKWTYSEEEE